MKNVGAILVLALTLAAQSNDQSRFSADVTRVNMLFTVSDRKGRFVNDLLQDDFEIVEGKKSQSIVEFSSETNLPLRLAILIDTSNSIRERFKFQQEAATDFINAVVRPHQDKVTIVSFDMSAELVADLTDDTEKLDKAIRDLRPGGGQHPARRGPHPPRAENAGGQDR